jgi:hypothetical protein
VNDEAVGWLRQVIEGDLAEARGLLSEAWGDRAWGVEDCGDTAAGYCPCIVYQGEYKPFDEPQVPFIRYIADAESPELAAWIAKHDLRSAIARCDAELAILDVCQRTGEAAEFPDHAGGYADGLEDAVKILASGYRHREGYAQHWGEVNEANQPRV